MRCRDPTSRPGRSSATRRRLPRTRAESPATRSGPPTITWSPAPRRSALAMAAASSSASTTSPPHDTVNGERAAAADRFAACFRKRSTPLPHRFQPSECAAATSRTAGIGAADPHRVATVARRVDRIAQRGHAFGDGPEVEPEALVLLAALLVTRAERDQQPLGSQDPRQRVEAVRQHRRGAQRRARDERPDTDALRRPRHRAHQREHLDRGSAFAGGVAAEEVVVREHARRVRAPPRPARPRATWRRRRGTTAT